VQIALPASLIPGHRSTPLRAVSCGYTNRFVVAGHDAAGHRRQHWHHVHRMAAQARFVALLHRSKAGLKSTTDSEVASSCSEERLAGLESEM
jgi:hypothetical protein